MCKYYIFQEVVARINHERIHHFANEVDVLFANSFCYCSLHFLYAIMNEAIEKVGVFSVLILCM